MTSDLEQLAARLERATVLAESASQYVASSYFERLILKAIGEAIQSANSPWVDRAGAAAYCRCSKSEIDRAADAGVFKRDFIASSPRFRKADLDAAIAGGKWRKPELSQIEEAA